MENIFLKDILCYSGYFIGHDIATDFIKALPGNSSVNSLSYTGGQQ
jgi:hypothetical protein